MFESLLSGIGIFNTLSAGRKDRRTKKKNARLIKEQTEKKASERQDELDDELGALKNQQSNSGLVFSGSAQDIARNNLRRAKKDIADILKTGLSRESNLISQARQSSTQSILDAGRQIGRKF